MDNSVQKTDHTTLMFPNNDVVRNLDSVNSTTTTLQNSNTTSPISQQVVAYRELTNEQRASLVAQATSLGDSAEYEILKTERVMVWYSGVDDLFYIELLDFDPTLTDRRDAESAISKITNTPQERVCDFGIVVTAAYTPFVVDKEIVENCPSRKP
ncbi:MAG: hypothetical protein KBD24_01265 [Candidatus Pacebacteria bacterium]|nr:hypothetical protein [Candidatus Paceibacterota bacterium]